ncbi:MAG: nodulation protein NfeD [Anaerolineae bacterium]|nr:nodulation protein NfeD [Anaerolineae bacterium]
MRIRPFRRARKALFLLYLAVALLGLVAPLAAQEPAGRALVLRVEGAITPVVATYIERGIETAEAEGADLLIIVLDTPGGSVDVTRRVTRRMQESRVPLVVYVAPEGAHAASAGTFVTLAAHVAAMAPGTSIGAASPIAGGGEELGETAKEKAISILEADVEGLARRRGEKAVEWARAAVREARAATEQEALEIGVIDVVATDLRDLLDKLDGRQVEVDGRTVTLETDGMALQELEMNAIEQFLHVITDPNIAFILMTLGINGILFELSSPGGYVAGIIGGICLMLGLYALGVLEANWIGLLLIAVAFLLFVLDVKAPTHGILTLGGVASFIFGSLILFQSPYYQISRALVVGVALATAGFFAFAVTKALRAQTRRPVTGLEGMIGRVAEARTDLAPQGAVFLMGEWWEAVAEDPPIARGEKVVVVGHEGFRLRVRRSQDGPSATPSG